MRAVRAPFCVPYCGEVGRRKRGSGFVAGKLQIQVLYEVPEVEEMSTEVGSLGENSEGLALAARLNLKY